MKSIKCPVGTYLIIIEFVYILSLLPTPKEIIHELNRILFDFFLWKGTDKVTRLPKITEYENGGLKTVDMESMMISLRLAWLAEKSFWRE